MRLRRGRAGPSGRRNRSGSATAVGLGLLLLPILPHSVGAQTDGAADVRLVPVINNPPVVTDVRVRTVAESAKIFAFAAADPDPGDRLRYTIAKQPDQGRVINNNDGTFRFDPAGAFADLQAGSREVRFTYWVTDRAGATREGTVTLVVEAEDRQQAAARSGDGARAEAAQQETAAQEGAQRAPRTGQDAQASSARAQPQKGENGAQPQPGTAAKAEQPKQAQQDASEAVDKEPAATIDMTGELNFVPRKVTLPVGGTVLWKNPSDVVHTVTADPEKAADPQHVHLPEGAKTFHSGIIQPGGSYRHTFTVPGRYQYVCLPHERMGMIGEVIVEEGPKKGAQAASPGETAESKQAEPEESAAAKAAEDAAKEGPEEATAQAAKETKPGEADRPKDAEQLDLRSAAVRRGEYLFRAGGCASCHTDRENGGAPLAGGRRLVTAFGTFYGSNITPDRETGIGAWSEADFLRAMKRGLAPDGSPYYPLFPYRWYASLYDFDLRDLWAYLRTITPVRNQVPPHDLRFPLSRRSLVHGWRLFDFEPAPAPAHPGRSRLWNRGSYLVNALAHCGACHTTKSALGTFRDEMFLAGSSQIPGGFVAPNITPDRETGIGSWSKADIVKLLKTGMRPDGAPVRGPMAEMVSDTTSRLTDEDREAIAVYLQSIPPVRHQPQQSEAASRQREARR